MTKIFKQLARHWAVCLVVFSLLFVQAYCDLSSPAIPKFYRSHFYRSG